MAVSCLILGLKLIFSRKHRFLCPKRINQSDITRLFEVGVLPHTSLYISLCNATHSVSEAQSLIVCTMIIHLLKLLSISAKQHRYMILSIGRSVTMGKTVTNVDRTYGPTHLLVFSGNKICLNDT